MASHALPFCFPKKGEPHVNRQKSSVVRQNRDSDDNRHLQHTHGDSFRKRRHALLLPLHGDVVGAGRALSLRLDDLRGRQPRGQDELAPPGDRCEHGLRRGAREDCVPHRRRHRRPLRMPSHVQNLWRHDARHVDGPGLPGHDVAALVDALPLGRARHGRLHAQGHPAPRRRKL